MVADHYYQHIVPTKFDFYSAQKLYLFPGVTDHLYRGCAVMVIY
jgi:hypothetical protein